MSGMAAWQRGGLSVGTCNVSVSCEWDGHGRSVDACGPIDHASVGLAQAHPNMCSDPWDASEHSTMATHTPSLRSKQTVASQLSCFEDRPLWCGTNVEALYKVLSNGFQGGCTPDGNIWV